MPWTPKSGTAELVARVGSDRALDVLTTLLGGLPPAEYSRASWRDVLVDIGDGHASRLLKDSTGRRLAHWPRAWAARSLTYLGHPGAAPALLEALDDPSWRVRMNVVTALGRLGVEGTGDRLVRMLHDDHDRVRSSVVTALGRLGDEDTIGALLGALDDPSEKTFRRVDRALAAIERRRSGHRRGV
jgi:HEAT repeat protein